MIDEIKGTILVVDDEPANLGVLFEYLQDAGFKVLVAENGRSALERVERTQPDIILLDVKMPDIDGFEVYRLMRERGKTDRTTVIFLSVMSEAETVAKGLELNAVDYITKPFQPLEVIARVEKHLALRNLRLELEEKNLQLAQEIEERKAAENALRLERDNFFNILENLPDGIYIVDQNYKVQYVNSALKEEFGLAEGQACFEYFHGREDVCPWCQNPKVFAGETVRWQWQSEKNQKIYDLIDTPLKNPDGSVWKLEIFRDITDRVNTEEALAEKSSYLDNILRSATENAIVTTDLDFRITYFNPLAEKIFGFSQEQAIGKLIREIRPVDVADDRFQQGLENIRVQGEHRYDTVLEIDGKPRQISSRLSGIIGPKGKLIGYARFSRDTTDKKRAEEALRDLAVMEERQRLARDLHDSMTQSLSSLILLADNALHLHQDGRYDRISSSLERLKETAQQTLKEMRLLLYQLQLTGDEQVDLFEILSTRLESVEYRLGIETNLQIDIVGSMPKAWESDIFYIIIEALNNALKHSGADQVSVSVQGNSYEIEVQVSDNGSGFDPVTLADCGMGLGNMSARADHLGGTLSIISQAGKGTQVQLTIKRVGKEMAH
ncbi:MAG: response regulator [Chloroflexi bacterium]|nr:response regulator [Chloroflexota bacterium]